MNDKKRLTILAMIMITALCATGSYVVTHAYFADAAASASNTFQAASEFPTITGTFSSTLDQTTPTMTPTPTPTATPGKIVINEVSPRGDNPAEWFEILNVGGTSVNVSGWTITDGDNSSDTLPNSIPLIDPNKYAILITSPSSVSVPAGVQTIVIPSLTIGNQLTDGGDALILKNATTIIDSMSYGTDTTVFSTPPAAPGVGQTLRRIPNGHDTDTAGDWAAGASSIGVSN